MKDSGRKNSSRLVKLATPAYSIHVSFFVWLLRTRVIFRRKNILEKKISNSVVGVFFFLKLPMTRTVQVCWVVGVLYNTCIGCHRVSESGGGEFEFRYRPYFWRLFGYSSTLSYFLIAKIRVFFVKNLGFFVAWASFLKNYPFSDVTETNCSFSII